MKIGVDIRTLMDKEYSGVSWYALDLLSAILRQDKANEYFLYYNSGRDIAERMPKLNQANVKTIFTRYPNKFFNYFLQKIFHWPKLDKISPLLSEEGFGGGVDFFWSPHFNFSSFSKNCRVVLTVHDLSFLAYQEFFSARKNLWHKFLGVRKLIERADILVAISENTKQDIIKFFQIKLEKIKVIYSGVGAEFQRLDSDNHNSAGVKEKYSLPDKFILNLGTFEPRKNISGLIRAFDAAADKPGMGEWHLVLAGSGGWKNKEIFQAINLAKNKSRIKIIGYVDKDERAVLYNLAGIFAYPSFYEGFGLPVLEAMACGTPVITSNISSIPEVAGDAALLIDPNDENSIIQAILALAGDEKLREIYSARGLERVKMFSWEKTAEKYLEIFSSFCHPEE